MTGEHQTVPRPAGAVVADRAHAAYLSTGPAAPTGWRAMTATLVSSTHGHARGNPGEIPAGCAGPAAARLCGGPSGRQRPGALRAGLGVPAGRRPARGDPRPRRPIGRAHV